MITKYHTKYPHISECIHKTASIVEQLRQHPRCELEARFGSITNNKFKPGVDRTVMDELIETMQTSDYLTGDEEWKEEKDVYFESKGKHMRTRVKYDSSSMIVLTETTEKKMICKPVDFKHSSNNLIHEQSIRVSLKSEDEIVDPPNSVNPYLVRIKQTKRFLTDNKCWAFDFSMVWSGKTKSDAEHSQMTEDALLEIECELVDADKMLQEKSDIYIASSLLLKMFDLLPISTNNKFLSL